MGVASHGGLGLDVITAEAMDAEAHTQWERKLDNARSPPHHPQDKQVEEMPPSCWTHMRVAFVEQDWPHGHVTHVDAQGPALRGNPQVT